MTKKLSIVKKINLIILLIMIIVGIMIGILILTEEAGNISKRYYKQPPEEMEKILITEEDFLDQMDYVYLHFDDYLGRIIEYEGYVKNIENSNDIKVGRDAFCCGLEPHVAGFTITGVKDQYQDDEWVRVTGILKEESEGNIVTLILEAKEIVKIEEGDRDLSHTDRPELWE